MRQTSIFFSKVLSLNFMDKKNIIKIENSIKNDQLDFFDKL